MRWVPPAEHSIGLTQSVKSEINIDDRARPMKADNGRVPIETGRPTCRVVAPSAPSELAWLLNLLVQTARYAEPALAELHASLLPGVN
jgi:hypothetical protein